MLVFVVRLLLMMKGLKMKKNHLWKKKLKKMGTKRTWRRLYIKCFFDPQKETLHLMLVFDWHVCFFVLAQSQETKETQPIHASGQGKAVKYQLYKVAGLHSYISHTRLYLYVRRRMDIFHIRFPVHFQCRIVHLGFPAVYGFWLPSRVYQFEHKSFYYIRLSKTS